MLAKIQYCSGGEEAASINNSRVSGQARKRPIRSFLTTSNEIRLIIGQISTIPHRNSRFPVPLQTLGRRHVLADPLILGMCCTSSLTEFHISTHLTYMHDTGQGGPIY